ncbi:uncharacterized protein LOC114960517 [Acropora millepora]|uniref:uncharacterized protein LOC114960517 n=1 Tax=Acropora millepora TaxID=45264 RepID=UPI001CF18451|nr:uncharacterized protein LOC114960517 [Acropora millepora]
MKFYRDDFPLCVDGCHMFLSLISADLLIRLRRVRLVSKLSEGYHKEKKSGRRVEPNKKFNSFCINHSTVIKEPPKRIARTVKKESSAGEYRKHSRQGEQTGFLHPKETTQFQQLT